MDQLVEDIMKKDNMSYEEALMYVLSLPSEEVIDDPNMRHNW